jgi:hypothetical protein
LVTQLRVRPTLACLKYCPLGHHSAVGWCCALTGMVRAASRISCCRWRALCRSSLLLAACRVSCCLLLCHRHDFGAWQSGLGLQRLGARPPDEHRFGIVESLVAGGSALGETVASTRALKRELNFAPSLLRRLPGYTCEGSSDSDVLDSSGSEEDCTAEEAAMYGFYHNDQELLTSCWHLSFPVLRSLHREAKAARASAPGSLLHGPGPMHVRRSRAGCCFAGKTPTLNRLL